jgi:hypothetical protein
MKPMTTSEHLIVELPSFEAPTHAPGASAAVHALNMVVNTGPPKRFDRFAQQLVLAGNRRFHRGGILPPQPRRNHP